MAYIIGIDIGTTNTKAVAFTDKGAVLASASASYPAFADQPGYHELDPEQLFEAVISVLKEATFGLKAIFGPNAAAGLNSAGGPESGPEGLAGISFSAAMHSLIAVDGAGNLLTRAITWADLRSQSYAVALKGSEAGKRIYRQTGTPVHPMSPLCKLLWLRDREPGIFTNAARFISIKEYIWWRLLGKYQVDHSIASATGLFDIYALNWYGESLELAGITAGRLSVPVPCTHSESALLPEYIDVLGLPAGLPFIIGGSDGCLANLGSLAVLPGETALTIGTSGAVRMTASAPKYDPKERIFNYILTDKLFVSGGATNNGGGVVQWFARQFPGGQTAGRRTDGPGTGGPGKAEPETAGQLASVEGEKDPGPEGKDLTAEGKDSPAGTMDLTAEADSVEPGSEGLVFLPYLQGERAPIWDANARGVFFGIRSEHEHRHFMRAVMEGIGFSLYQVGTSLEETIGPIRHVYASGGFIRSKTWLQMIADIFNRRVYVTGVADASAIGAVVLGFYALGVIQELREVTGMIRVHETYEPDEGRHRIYMKNFAVYVALYERLKDLM